MVHKILGGLFLMPWSNGRAGFWLLICFVLGHNTVVFVTTATDFYPQVLYPKRYSVEVDTMANTPRLSGIGMESPGLLPFCLNPSGV